MADQSFVVTAAKTLRIAAKVRALEHGADAAGAMTGRLTGYVLGVYPALDELAAATAELEAAEWPTEGAPEEAIARHTAACRRHHHAVAAAIRAHRGEPPATSAPSDV